MAPPRGVGSGAVAAAGASAAGASRAPDDARRSVGGADGAPGSTSEWVRRRSAIATGGERKPTARRHNAGVFFFFFFFRCVNLFPTSYQPPSAGLRTRFCLTRLTDCFFRAVILSPPPKQRNTPPPGAEGKSTALFSPRTYPPPHTLSKQALVLAEHDDQHKHKQRPHGRPHGGGDEDGVGFFILVVEVHAKDA